MGYEYPVNRDVVNMADNEFLGTFSTNVDEEMVGLCKNSKEAKAVSRFRKPATSMARILG